MDNDFCYTTRFEVEPEWFSMDGLFLRFDGIDTLADIYVNQQLLGSAYNMHRSWEYDLLDGDLLKEGMNELQVILHSPTQYIKEENAKAVSYTHLDVYKRQLQNRRCGFDSYCPCFKTLVFTRVFLFHVNFRVNFY